MKRALKNFSLVFTGAVIGTAAATAVVPFIHQLGVPGFDGMAMNSAMSDAATEPQPLYWVAPMDPNYRRDKPGLSPMGMELVPFYGEAEKKPKEPLYWVAPMDPNYRRDKPGLSPMGMDLVPFYGDDGGDDAGPGTISISSEVVNNLGVRTAGVKFCPLDFEVKTVGYVQYNQDQMIHVHPRVEGWLEKVYIKAAGEQVIKDQPLYELYSPELVNAQEELIFALSRGDRRLIRAAERRLQSLQVPAQTIAQLKKSRKVSQTVTFYAPTSGVVENFAMQEGFYVKPGKMLMSVASLDEVWIEAEVFERQAGLVKTGAPVTVRLDYLPGQSWQGAVDYVYPTLDKMNRTLRVRIRFPNPGLILKPNMYAEVSISAESDESVLNVPREALIRVGESDRVVLALGDGRFKSVNVLAGRHDGERVEILEGLKRDDSVVTSAQFLLDSESSKTSDFKRMHQPDSMQAASNSMSMPAMDMSAIAMTDGMTAMPAGSEMSDWIAMKTGRELPEATAMNMSDMAGMNMSGGMMSDSQEKQPVAKVWTTGTINKLLNNGRRVNLNHADIAEWNWPSMNMNLGLAEGISSEELQQGMKIAIEITRNSNGVHVITDVELLDNIGLPAAQER